MTDGEYMCFLYIYSITAGYLFMVQIYILILMFSCFTNTVKKLKLLIELMFYYFIIKYIAI